MAYLRMSTEEKTLFLSKVPCNLVLRLRIYKELLIDTKHLAFFKYIISA